MRRLGDSIALRLLDFDRFYMQVVGIGQHPGEMLAKSGTTAEIARFEAEWDRGRPAILHAVTTCLRIGDVSVRTADGWEPIEVKMSESAHVRGNQRRNLRLALATLRPGSEPTKVEPAERFPFTTPVTHWLSTLGDVLVAAAKDGVASARLEDYGNVLALDLRTLGDGRSREEGGSAIEAAWDRVALAVPPSAIAVRGWSAEKQRLSQFGMPFTSYPFPEPVCAALAAGYLSFTVVLDLQQIASRIRRAGFGCEVILSETEERWFRVSRGNDTVTVPESVGERMLYEALHPDCLIGALRELAAAGDSDEPHAKEIVPTFADEGAIWA